MLRLQEPGCHNQVLSSNRVPQSCGSPTICFQGAFASDTPLKALPAWWGCKYRNISPGVFFFLQTCPSHHSIICAIPPAAPIHGMTFFSASLASPSIPLPPSLLPFPAQRRESGANRLLQTIKCHYKLRAASPWDARRSQPTRPLRQGAQHFSLLLPGKQKPLQGMLLWGVKPQRA